MSWTGLLRDTATVTRKSRSADGAGGYTYTYTTVTTTLACRVSRQNAMIRTQAGAIRAVGDYKLFTDTDADLKVDDRVTIGSLVYEVVGLVRPSQHHLEYDLELIEGHG